MPAFEYKAKKDTAETVVGQIVAQDQDEAVELISQLGLVPVTVEEKSSSTQSKGLSFLNKVRPKELYLFTRQLANMLKTGIPFLKALEMIIKQIPNPYFSNILSQIKDQVYDGRSFSKALEDYPDVFSSLYVAMVRAGEESGKLREMLSSIAVYQKNQDALASKIRSSLTYPIVMAFVGFATICFILVYVMPKLSGLFNSLGDSIPLVTQMVLSLSLFLQKFWLLVVVLVATIGLFVKYGKRSRRVRAKFLKILFKLPWVGSFLVKVELERFFRTLHLLLNSGIPILKAIDVSIPILKDARLKKELFLCLDELKEGSSLGKFLTASVLVPEMASQLISIGEESGSLAESLNDLSDSYRQDIEETTSVLTTLLEPLMILLIGSVVAFIVFSMLLPIFQMDILAQ